MSKYFLGIDLGSTTCKAIIINESDEIIGRGITNTRANYKVATDIAKQEAIFDARFSLLRNKLQSEIDTKKEYQLYFKDIRAVFQYLQFKKRLEILHNQLNKTIDLSAYSSIKDELKKIIDELISKVEPEIANNYLHGNLGEKNQFFRDIISEKYNEEVEKFGKAFYEPLLHTFDKSITPVENELIEFDFKQLVHGAILLLDKKYSKIFADSSNGTNINFNAELNLLMGNHEKVSDSIVKHIEQVADADIHIANMVGTGYGRALLPFPEDCIKSEILCHALGAHIYFPNTRTVLDIGGQDTKAIQVNSQGIVTSFHMNDRCAAGCGRYLGYIADEFSISLNELGPLAMEGKKEINICSTCTVFAGAEIRELLTIGEKREDILSGLHKSLVMRAMSLLARSGGVKSEFTFTGGVARNQAVLNYVAKMVKESYGDNIVINIHTDSIFMGALGAAMFAKRGSIKQHLKNIPNKMKVVLQDE